MARGYLYTLEAMIAAFLIFVTIIYVFRGISSEDETKYLKIKSLCYDAIEYLDNVGLIREYVYKGFKEQLEEKLEEILPSSLEVEVEFCTDDCRISSLPVKKSVIIVDHYISGFRSTYEYKKVRVYLWEKY